MRKLKFRIWYADEKRYLETPDGLFFKYPHSNQGEYFGKFVEGPYDSGEYIGDFITDPYFVEQFTGLLDSTGKEIYEGDIVCWKHPMEDFGQVKFVTESFGPDVAYFCVSTKRLGDCHFQNDNKYTVLGNIHENPELLTA